MPQLTCPICKMGVRKISNDCRAYDCPKCGEYLLYEALWCEVGYNKEKKSFIKKYLSEHKDANKGFILGIHREKEHKEDHLFDLKNIKNICMSEIENYCLTHK